MKQEEIPLLSHLCILTVVLHILRDAHGVERGGRVEIGERVAYLSEWPFPQPEYFI